MNLLVCTVLCLCGQITAEHWSRSLTLVPGDDRTYVVLFFSSRGDKEKTVECVRRLDVLRDRRNVLTIAVTPERQSVADAFLRAFNPYFAVGSRSPSYKHYGIKNFPSILVLRPSGNSPVPIRIDVTSDSAERLAERFPPEPPPSSEANEESLKRFVRLSSPSELSAVADILGQLRRKLSDKDFIAFCDDIEWQNGFNNRWLGQVRYERHLADPSQPVKQSDPPSRTALRTLKEADPQSLEVREWRSFAEILDRLPDDDIDSWIQLRTVHGSTTEALDLAFRLEMAQTLASRIGRCIDGELDTRFLSSHVALLRQLYESEQDAGVKYFLLTGLIGLEQEHHDHLPDLPIWLKTQLDAEQDIRWVRPMLEQLLFETSGGDP